MQNRLPQKWNWILDTLDIAFQPIINIHTGKIFAVEALLRNYQEAGFNSIHDIFDQLYLNDLIYSFDIQLRRKAIAKYVQIEGYKEIKLFYNLDNRIFEMSDFTTGNTSKILDHYGIEKENICFELSERHEFAMDCDISLIAHHYKERNYCIAIDDFGTGHSGFKLLYQSTPNVLKIDRFFLNNIQKDMKKKMLVRNITYLCIQLGIKVVAEGVESKDEYLTCKDIGCHLVQGYLVQRPTQKVNEINQFYPHIFDIVQMDKRGSSMTLQKYIDIIQPINFKTKMTDVVKYFKLNPNIDTLPIINAQNEPVGILYQDQIKEFLYSPYGMSLLLNDSAKKSKLKNMIRACSTTDINSSISTIIELFSNSPESVGIIITQNSSYYGFLTARSIINIMNEQNIKQAREQNPLTKLPGNTKINEYMNTILDSSDNYMVCYFDLDHFKAYNDVYGFRNGDRVILLFAEMLKKELSREFFTGHIGGDDFFIACKIRNEEVILKYIENIIRKFTFDVIAFYSHEDRERGYIISRDRDNKVKNFPLLTVSVSMLFITPHAKYRTPEMINLILSRQKKVAKAKTDHVCMSSML